MTIYLYWDDDILSQLKTGTKSATTKQTKKPTKKGKKKC